jgi:peptide-methionine (S)-S-oxide reductase
MRMMRVRAARVLIPSILRSIALSVAVTGCASLAGARFPDPPLDPAPAGGGAAVAVLAGGCFWGMEAVFESLAGVSDVVSGYSGGSPESAFYDAVVTGNTGHAESVWIEYDPARISYGTLLKVFFSVAHDPTRLDSQFPDVGTQYRSVIFVSGEEQRAAARAYIDRLDRSGILAGPIATEVVSLAGFYRAEDYHQDFVAHNPGMRYVMEWDLPLLEKLKRTYPRLVTRG